MLKSNWNVDLEECQRAGRVHVIRQKLGRVPARKSNAVHVFMDAESRASLAAKLEREWVGTLISKR